MAESTRFLPLTMGVLLLAACGAPTPGAGPAGGDRGNRAQAMPKIDDAGAGTLAGTVTAIEYAGSYTYLELETAEAEPAWVVTMGRPKLSVGSKAAFEVSGTARDFHSRRLDRDFPLLAFGRPSSTQPRTTPTKKQRS